MGKIFTPEQASNMLPLVRRIVTDAKACHKLIARHNRALGELAAAIGTKSEEALEHREKIESLETKLTECKAELDDLGCELVDGHEGVIRVCGEVEGNIVYLTWRLGESKVSHWYPVDKTHRERRALDDGERVAENFSGR